MKDKGYYERYNLLIEEIFQQIPVFLKDIENARIKIKYEKEDQIFRGHNKRPLEIKIKTNSSKDRYNLVINSLDKNPEKPDPNEVIYVLKFPKKENTNFRFKKFMKNNLKNIEDFIVK